MTIPERPSCRGLWELSQFSELFVNCDNYVKVYIVLINCQKIQTIIKVVRIFCEFVEAGVVGIVGVVSIVVKL